MPSITLDHLPCRLPAEAYHQLIHTLRLTLPPPPGAQAGPDDFARRDHATIATVAALVPANTAEASLAADFVAASELGRDCLRLAQLPETTPERAAQCQAQALRMMREAKSALRLLLKLQDARGKREADSAACNSAAWSEHCAIALMAEALVPAAKQAAMAQPAEPATPPAPEPAPQLPPQPALAPVEEAQPDPVAEAEHYAALYPERAAQIRRLGRLPDNVPFGPPDEDLVQALITARTPALAALDREFAQARAA